LSSNKPFLSFVVEPELLKRLDEFRFKHHFASRAGAIKFLIRWGLDQKAKPANVRPLETMTQARPASAVVRSKKAAAKKKAKKLG
jgi:hypothetical protein